MNDEEKQARLEELRQKLNELPGYTMRLPLTPQEKMLEYLLKPFNEATDAQIQDINERIEFHSDYPPIEFKQWQRETWDATKEFRIDEQGRIVPK